MNKILDPLKNKIILYSKIMPYKIRRKKKLSVKFSFRSSLWSIYIFMEKYIPFIFYYT